MIFSPLNAATWGDMAKDKEAEFIPGMEASVELVGEKRSIAAYLTKPFSQFKSEAFREK